MITIASGLLAAYLIRQANELPTLDNNVSVVSDIKEAPIPAPVIVTEPNDVPEPVLEPEPQKIEPVVAETEQEPAPLRRKASDALDPETLARYQYFAGPNTTARLYTLMNLARSENEDLEWAGPIRQSAREVYQKLREEAGGIGPEDIQMECGSTVCFIASDELDPSTMMSPLQSSIQKHFRETNPDGLGITWGTRSDVFGWVIVFTSADFVPPPPP